MRSKTLLVGVCVALLLSLVLACSAAEAPQASQPTSVVGKVSTPTSAAAPTAAAPAATIAPPVATVTPPQAKEKPRYGGAVVSSLSTGFQSFDPADNPSGSGSIMSTVFEHMTEPDWKKGPAGTGELEWKKFGISAYAPGLTGLIAESWERPDDKTVIFHIRQRLRYAMTSSEASKLANGREATAADMAAAMNRYLENSSAQLPGRPYVESITATDKYTVVLKLKTVYYDVWDDIANRLPGPYPPELVAKYGNLRDWKNWVGTGPFILVDVVPDSSATLVKNPNYWGFDPINPENRLPYVDGIKWLVMLDTASRVAAFRTYKIDVLSPLTDSEFTSLQRTNPELVVVGKNLRGNGRAFPNVQEPPFNDVRVRQALLMAIDFDTIVRDYYGGAGHPRGYPLDVSSKEYVPTDELPEKLKDLWTYHPDKAKALLAAAGHPNGFEFPLIVDSRVSEQALIFQNYWKAIGAIAKIELVDGKKASSLRYQAGEKAAFKGMLIISGGGAENMPNVAQQAYSGSAWNSGGFSDPYFDRTWDRLSGVPDLYANLDELKELGLYVMEQVTRIDFPLSYNYAVSQSWVKNFYPPGTQTGLSSSFYWGLNPVNYLWIDRELRSSVVGK